MQNFDFFSSVLKVVALPKRWIVNLIYIQEKKTYNFYVVLLFALFVALVRYMLEVILSYKYMLLLNWTLISSLAFYLHCIFIYTFILALFIPNFQWKQSIHLVLIGVFMGVFPPIIDVFNAGLGEFDYQYVVNYKDDWRWLIYNTEGGVPLGEATTLFITIFFVGVMVYLKTQSVIRATLALLLTYCSVFFYGGLLPLVSDYISEAMYQHSLENPSTFSKSWFESVDPPKVAVLAYLQILVCVAIYLFLNPVLFKHLASRLNHALPVVLTCLLGFSVYEAVNGYALLIASISFFAALVVLVQNDFFDSDEDALAGRPVCVNKDDVAFFNTMILIVVALLVATANFAGYMLLLFMVASYLYNYDYYRGKRYFPSNYKLEGIAGLAAYLMGTFMMVSTTYNVSGDALNAQDFVHATKGLVIGMEEIWSRVWSMDKVWIAFFVFGGWSILSVVKDYKDIENDRQVGNQTAYTLLQKRGKNIQKFHRVYTTLLALSMLIPVFWLRTVGAPVLSIFAVVVLALLFVVGINREASKRSVALAFGAINLYLLNLVTAFHLSHA